MAHAAPGLTPHRRNFHGCRRARLANQRRYCHHRAATDCLSDDHQGHLSAAGRHAMKGRVVIITGGASGIGAVTAQALLAQGATPVLLDCDAASLAATRASLGGSCSPFAWT